MKLALADFLCPARHRNHFSHKKMGKIYLSHKGVSLTLLFILKWMISGELFLLALPKHRAWLKGLEMLIQKYMLA